MGSEDGKPGVFVYIPANVNDDETYLKIGERRTVAFNIPIYERAVGDANGPKQLRLFWDFRVVFGHGREYFGAFVGEAPINGLLPPVPEDTFILPASGEEFSLGELMLFGNAGLPKDVPVDGSNSSWFVTDKNDIGAAFQKFTPGRLVGSDGAVSERLTRDGTATLPLDPGVDAILELAGNNNNNNSSPNIFVKVSVNSRNITYPARGRFHLTLYSRPEQIAGRDTPEAIVHFYYDVVAPGRTRNAADVARTEIGNWESDVVSDAPVAVGTVFSGKPGQEIDPLTGPILEWLARYHVTVYVDNTGGTPTFQFGRLPSAASLYFGLPADATLRLTVWETPRGTLPDEVWEFSNVGFSRSSAATARDLADAIDGGDALNVFAAVENIRHHFGASSLSTTVNAAVDGVLPLHRAMSLAAPPPPGDADRTDQGELKISTSPAAVDMVRILLDAGADANNGGGGAPPLHYAIDQLRYDGDQGDSHKNKHGIIIEEQALIVSLLLDAGANPKAGNHVTGGGATNNTNYAIHRVAQRWFFGMLPVMDELLRGGPGRILPDFGTADPLNDSNSPGHDSPDEPVLDRFIGHRTFGKHWDSSSYDQTREDAFRRVIQRIRNLGGECGTQHGNTGIVSFCSLVPTAP